MQIYTKKETLRLYPISLIEESYIEKTLGLKKEGNSIKLVRHDDGDSFFLEAGWKSKK